MAQTISFFLILISLSNSAVAASSMGTFLKSCAYGTAGGAALGLASLAISDHPSSKMSNVARGASLGLYAGIAYGFYALEKNREINASNQPDLDVNNSIYFSPVIADQKMDGLQMNWLSASF